MRRPVALLLCLVLLFSFTACKDGNVSGETGLTVEEISAVIIGGQEEMPALYALRPADATYMSEAESYLHNLTDSVEDGIICYPYGVEAAEVAVFRFADGDKAEAAKEPLQAYIDGRVAVFTGYAPEQAALAAKGTVAVNGCYAALLICPDPAAAEESFASCFGKTPPAVEPEGLFVEAPAPVEGSMGAVEDVYDHEAILSAWKSGDTADLTPKNLATLSVAQLAIDTVITDGMTDYEKELAIHDWMIAEGEYDHGDLTHDGSADAESGNPYGFLVQGRGICLGYATTFQLFMDLLDIECITVEGFSMGEDHAWNMVCLDGDWYCVDVTWDASLSQSEYDYFSHYYFNLTSEQMKPAHEWDEDSLPEATGGPYTGGYT